MSSHKEDWEIEFLLFFKSWYIATYNKTKVFLLERKKGEWILCRHPTLPAAILKKSFNAFSPSFLSTFHHFMLRKWGQVTYSTSYSQFMAKLELKFTSMTRNTVGLFPVYAAILWFHKLCTEPTQLYWCHSSSYSPNSVSRSPDSGLYLARCCVSFNLKSNIVWLRLENE